MTAFKTGPSDATSRPPPLLGSSPSSPPNSPGMAGAAGARTMPDTKSQYGERACVWVPQAEWLPISSLMPRVFKIWSETPVSVSPTPAATSATSPSPINPPISLGSSPRKLGKAAKASVLEVTALRMGPKAATSRPPASPGSPAISPPSNPGKDGAALGSCSRRGTRRQYGFKHGHKAGDILACQGAVGAPNRANDAVDCAANTAAANLVSNVRDGTGKIQQLSVAAANGCH
ncbi:hypothetical protein ACK3TF_001409 [Chlorella vulgaris]